jgi:hypothetical protein
MKMFLLTNLRDPDPLHKGVPAVEFKYFKRYFALFFLKYLTFTLAPGIGITVADLNKKFSHTVFTNINLKINKICSTWNKRCSNGFEKQKLRKMKAIFTIESYENGYYFDLLSNLKFGVNYYEKLVFSSSDPNECIEYLQSKNCMCYENYNYSYLLK